MRALGLRCEYRENPEGLDVARPRLSWVLEAQERNQVQRAYQVRVSAAGLLWDSGKRESSEQNQIEYAGPTLLSHQKCTWSVRVWDKADQPGPWSPPASWSMGILEPQDWKAQWICAPTATRLPLFRQEFEVNGPVDRAILYACGLGFH